MFDFFKNKLDKKDDKSEQLKNLLGDDDFLKLKELINNEKIFRLK